MLISIIKGPFHLNNKSVPFYLYTVLFPEWNRPTIMFTFTLRHLSFIICITQRHRNTSEHIRRKKNRYRTQLAIFTYNYIYSISKCSFCVLCPRQEWYVRSQFLSPDVLRWQTPTWLTVSTLRPILPCPPDPYHLSPYPFCTASQWYPNDVYYFTS